VWTLSASLVEGVSAVGIDDAAILEPFFPDRAFLFEKSSDFNLLCTLRGNMIFAEDLTIFRSTPTTASGAASFPLVPPPRSRVYSTGGGLPVS